MVEPTGKPGEGRSGNGSQRARLPMILLFVLAPPVAGSAIASLLLMVPGREPWVITGGFLLGIVFFLLAEPLGRRSDGFRIALYRRLAEAAVFLGLTCGAVVAYAVLVHTLLGFRAPWFRDVLTGLVGA